jgi:OmpA-OmpF porin, OOP family
MKPIQFLITVLCLCMGAAFILPSEGRSQERAGSVSVSPMGGVHVFDNRQDIEKDATGGVGVGYNITEHWGAEIQFQGGRFDHEYFDFENCRCSDDELNAYIAHLDALYHFRPGKRLVPYLSAGVGGVRVEGDHYEDDTYGVVNYGAGVKYHITDNIALRGEARHLHGWEDSNNNVAATVGVSFQFGGKKKEKPAPPPEPEEDPPALGVVVEERAPEPEEVPVDVEEFKPAPLADDEKLAIDLKILFDFDRAVIKPAYYPNLNKIGAFMRDYPETQAVIEGHTDDVGSLSYNMKLSWNRAESVRRYLIQNFGIAPDRLEARGYGKSVPVADNATEEGRQKNRRVILVVSNGNGAEKTRIFREEYEPRPSEQGSGAAPTPQKSKSPVNPGKSGQTLEDVKIDTSGDTVTATLLTGAPVAKYHVFTLKDPYRVVIDLPGRWRRTGKNREFVDKGNVQRVRFGIHSDKLRVVLDLKGKLKGEPRVRTASDGLRVSMIGEDGVALSSR